MLKRARALPPFCPHPKSQCGFPKEEVNAGVPPAISGKGLDSAARRGSGRHVEKGARLAPLLPSPPRQGEEWLTGWVRQAGASFHFSYAFFGQLPLYPRTNFPRFQAPQPYETDSFLGNESVKIAKLSAFVGFCQLGAVLPPSPIPPAR